MKYSKYLLSLVLLCGTIFSWYTVFNDFLIFYADEGTFFKVENCVVPNPVTTPCFYGAFAFLFAFFWSIYFLVIKDEHQKKNLKKIFWFLIASNIFAWTNFGIILVRFIKAEGHPSIGCSGQIMTNPLNTPCFIGSGIFLLSLIVTYIMKKK